MPTAQGPTIWFWVGAAAAGGDEVLAAACYGPSGWYVEQVDQDDGELQAFWSGTLNDSTTTLDDFVAFLVGPPASDDVQATQDYNDDYHPHAVIIQIDDDYWGNVYGFPDQALDVTAAFNPPAVVEPVETFAAQPLSEQPWFPEVEWEDYDHTAEPNEWLVAPPDAALEVFIAQPLAEQPWFPDQETEDYHQPPEQNEFLSGTVPDAELAANAHLLEQPWFPDQELEDYLAPPEQLEPFAPPEIVVPELAAATELREQPWFPDQETEDYNQDPSVEVPHLYPSGAVEPIETFAAQPLSEQAWFDGEVLEDYGTLPEQLEPFAPPEAVVPELLAAQPHYGEAFWPDLDTEDYQQDSSLDVSPQFFQVALEPDSTFAAQPHYGEWFWEAQETEDYAGLPLQNGFLSGTVPDEELAANAQILEQPWFEAQEVEDYGSDTPLGIEAATLVPAFDLFAPLDLPEHWHYEVETWIDPPLDDAIWAILAGPFLGADAVRGPTQKRPLAGASTTTSELAGPSQTRNLGGGATESEELAGAPRAVPIGGSQNDLEEV